MAIPKENMVIEVPSELVDDENHPLRYRPFKYEEYIHYRYLNPVQEGALEKFGGL